MHLGLVCIYFYEVVKRRPAYAKLLGCPGDIPCISYKRFLYCLSLCFPADILWGKDKAYSLDHIQDIAEYGARDQDKRNEVGSNKKGMLTPHPLLNRLVVN
jgi:hypothetical protein